MQDIMIARQTICRSQADGLS